MIDDTAADLFTEGAHHRDIFPGENDQIHVSFKRRITSILQNCKQRITVRNKWVL